MSQDIYKDIPQSTLNSLKESIRPRLNSFIMHCNYTIKPWLAIYAPFLNKHDRKIVLTSNKCYYRQVDIDNAYPNNIHEGILEPFDRYEDPSNYLVYFIDTTTGTKIYNYADQLIDDDDVDHTGFDHAEVALTQDKFHKLKLVKKRNILYVLTNTLTEKLVNDVLIMLPNLFNMTDITLDDNLTNCRKAISDEQPIKPYIEDLLELIKETEQNKLRESFKKAMTASKGIVKTKLKSKIETNKQNIKGYHERLEELYTILEDLQLKLLGLETTEDISQEDADQVLNFIQRHPYITDIVMKEDRDSYYNTYYYPMITVKAPITIYETEPLERSLDSYISRGEDEYTEMFLDICKVYKKVFLEEKYQMYCETRISIDLVRHRINAGRYDNGFDRDDFELIEQPHLSRFNCWGDNYDRILEAISTGDVIKALNLIIIATQNYNFTDSAVLRNNISDICSYSNWYTAKSFKNVEDGKFYSMKELVKDLKDKD